MFTNSIDLGQVITAALIGIIGFFMKREINTIGKRLDKHDDILFEFAKSIGEKK